MQNWQPQQQDLQGLIQLLQDYSSTNTQVQAQVVKVFLNVISVFYSNWNLSTKFLIFINI
jgi:hypothetical protein